MRSQTFVDIAVASISRFGVVLTVMVMPAALALSFLGVTMGKIGQKSSSLSCLVAT